MDVQAGARSAATLLVLTLVFVLSVAWAWSQVTEPFPEAIDDPDCNDVLISTGQDVTPEDVLVSVFNAGGRDGLAGETLDRLGRFGFGEGELGDAPKIKGSAQIWTDQPDGAVARLLASYLGDGVKVVDQASSAPGVTVVVGEEFPGVSKGSRSETAGEDTYVCSPPEQDGDTAE